MGAAAAPRHRTVGSATWMNRAGCFMTGCSLIQDDGTVGGPTQVDLIAPIDGPFGRAAVVLGKNRDQLAGFGLDAIGGAIAEIPELPNGAFDLIDGFALPAAGDRLLAQPDLL